MEETNYHRKVSSHENTILHTGVESAPSDAEVGVDDSEKSNSEIKADDSVDGSRECGSHNDQRSKSYLNKLRLFDKRELQYPNQLKGMVLRPLIFLSFPVILYAGFSYGSNLIWFNVLNGTASHILSEEPYGFASSKVGLAYISPLVGVTLG